MPENSSDGLSRLPSGNNPLLALGGGYTVRDPEALSHAAAYIGEYPVDMRPLAEIPVAQPPNQKQIANDLEHNLTVNQTAEEAKIWKSYLGKNFDLIRLQSGITRVDVKLFDITLPAAGDQDSPTRYLSSHQQITDPTETNPMLTGLLNLTGAQKLRDQLEEGDKDGFRLYKGMYEGSPVYFVDRLTFVPKRRRQQAYYEREFQVATEQCAERLYNELSQSDRAVLDLVSITLASFDSKDGRHESVGGRRRMTEVIKLYKLFNLNNSDEKDVDEGQIATGVNEVTYEGGNLNARVGSLMIRSAFRALVSLDVNDSLRSAGVKDFK